jgi:hypothetical protein
VSGPRRPTSAHVRAAAPFAGHEDKKGTFEASVIVWNGASTIPAGSRVALRFVEAFGGIGPRCVRRALATGGRAELPAERIIQSQRCDRDCASVSAAALQLWIGRQQWLDDIRRGRDDVVDASTHN